MRQLRTSAAKLAQLVAVGEADLATVEAELLFAAMDRDLSVGKATKAIQQAIDSELANT